MRNLVRSLTLAATLTTFGYAAPFVNGNFEAGATGWSTSGNVAANALYSSPSDPLNFGLGLAAFSVGDTANNGILSQTFDTVLGQAYTVRFSFGNLNLSGSPTTQSVLAEVLNATATTIASLPVSSLAPTNTGASLALVYSGSPYAFSFVANSLTSTLRFTDVGAQTISTDGFLDNISVTANTGAPELDGACSTAPMLFGALALLIATSRRRRVLIAG